MSIKSARFGTRVLANIVREASNSRKSDET